MSKPPVKPKKEKEEVSDVLDEVLKKHELLDEAHDFIFDKANKLWMKVTVKYNLETKEAKVDSIKEFARSVPMALQGIDDFFIDKITKAGKKWEQVNH